MPSSIALAAIVGLFTAAFTTAAPTARATCPSTFPSSFQIKEGSGYFQASISKDTIIHDINKSTASYFYINNTVYEGPTVPLLSYTAGGVKYGAFVTDSTNGTIVLVPSTTTPPNSYLPVEATLEANCAISLTLFEAHADSILQDCAGNIVLATSQEHNCVLVSSTLVTS